MAKGIFIGLTLAQVSAIQSKAVEMLMEGKTTMSYSTGDGISVSKSFPMSISTILEECSFVINRLNGTALPRRTVSDFSGVRR